MGRYVLTRSLGSGGMGDVFAARAFAAAGVEKDVCIKRIRRERLARSDAVDRFIDEARLSVRLNHGHIVQVFDFGRAGDEYYLAMEYVDGADLDRVLVEARAARDPLEPEVAAHVGACVAQALAYAHTPRPGERAVVHCDLKPANVLISRAGEVKLADFGAAAIEGGGLRGGTVGYMAPERAARGVADPKVDLYSLGVLLVEMFSGHRPPHDTTHLESVPDELAPLVRALLATAPEDRPHDAAAVADALERYGSRARAAGRPAPAPDLARRAAALADADRGTPLAKEMPTEASFERDGSDAREFRGRMTDATESTAPENAPPTAHDEPAPNVTNRGAERARRRPWVSIVGAVLAVALATGLGIWAARPQSRTSGFEARRVELRSVSQPHPGDDTFSGSRPETRFDASTGAGDGERPHAPAPSAGPETSAPPTRAPDNAGSLAQPRGSSPTRRYRVADAGVSAEPRLPATLDLNAIPWAHVALDGRALGETPRFGVEAAAGAHRITFDNPALGVRRDLSITVEPGEHRHVVVRLAGE